MDDVAAAAGVSKVTLYKQFGDKRGLFEHVVSRVSVRAGSVTSDIDDRLGAIGRTSELEPMLVALAIAYARAVIADDVVRLRRLIISEAERHPDLAATYFDHAPRQAIETLAVGFARLGERGLLQVADPNTAATQFAYLVLGPLVDRRLFHPGRRIAARELSVHAQAAVVTFLAAYGPAAGRRPVSR
jgi:TetR/AcrR family transcriptional repressor of mexJK operon